MGFIWRNHEADGPRSTFGTGLIPRKPPAAPPVGSVRMGHITGIGKNTLRAILVEASWQLITKDRVMPRSMIGPKSVQEESAPLWPLPVPCCLRMRRMLLDERVYALQLRAWP